MQILRILLLALLLSGPGFLYSAQAAGQASAVAEVSRLSDREVRDILIEELSTKNDRAEQADEEFNPAVIMLRFQRDTGKVSKQLSAIFASVVELPSIFPKAWAIFSADRQDGGVLWFVLALIVSMGLGALAAYGLRARLTGAIGNIEERRPDSARKKAAVLGSRLLVHLLYTVVFVAISTAVFIVFFDEGQKDRTTFFFYLAASAIFMLSIALSVAFHAPQRPALRLPHYSDADAKAQHRTALITVGFGAFAYFTCALMGTLGILGDVHQLFLILVGTATIGLLMYSIISGRRAIAGDIGNNAGRDSPRAIFAKVWPWVFVIFLAVLWVGIVVRELLYDFVPYGAALFTIGVLFAVPSLDALMAREAQKFLAAGREIETVLAKGSRFVLAALTVVALSVAWRINPFASGGGTGAKITSSLLQVSITCLVAYVAWQLVRIFIDKKIAEEDALLAAQGIDLSEAEMGGEGLSRTRTLLPLLRRSVQITLMTISTMIVLASLGVDIAPLLAGAGVVGLAIGFGSQTLVRDVVSGAFFLMDDAFRIGEYINVGAVQGTVEKMSIRSVRLRHHRGAVHTVPFGEVKTLTNYSRDWAIMKLKFQVPFDTDIDKLRKILKKVGQELSENEVIKDDFIQPFKSQGAVEANDNGFVISTKFTSKPGKQFFIRRYIFNAVQKAFQDNGIEFAKPKVEVSVGDNDDRDRPAKDSPREDRASSQSDMSTAGGAASQLTGAAETTA